MLGDERGSAKEISLFFYVASVPGLSGFLDNETGHARANSGHPTSDSCHLVTIGSLATHQILAQLATRILRYGGGVHGRTCRDPTPPMTCGKHLLNDLQPTYQI